MANQDRFKQTVITTLAKRAANRCSNPDCNAITSGPSSEPLSSINVGEAAHIYGANPGSARFDPNMVSSDRSAISNAIWLCGNCHKLIDDDPVRYPVGILFAWQREHERSISNQIGKAGAEIRKRYEDRHLEEFGRLSYLSERLIIEKDSFWEYQLTAEVLRFEMRPVLQRWNALQRELYFKPHKRIDRDDFMPWIQTKNSELISMMKAFDELANKEFASAWGAPGVPGNETEIILTSRLFSEMCQSALAWEESVRFTAVDQVFADIRHLYIGMAGRIIDEAEKLPMFLSETLGKAPVAGGNYLLNLTLSLPDGWSEAVETAFDTATHAVIYDT